MAGSRAPSASKDQTPLVELFASLRKDNYTLSRKESEVLLKCSGRMKTHGVEGFVVAGSTVWAVTGSLKLPQRLIATLAGATASGVFLMRWSTRICMNDILALDGSLVQERFAAILQKQALRKPHIRSLLEKYYYIEPLYDDSAQNSPGVVMRKLESADVGFKKILREEDHSGEDSSPPQTGNEVSTISERLDEPAAKESKENTTVNSLKVDGSSHPRTVSLHDEASEGPFDMLWGTEPKDEESSTKLAMKGKQKNNAKIGVLERRERNRAHYLEWQEKRSTSGWGDTLSE